MNQTVAAVLKTFLLAQPPQTQCQAVLLMDGALVTAMHTLSSTVSTIFQAKLGALALFQDMSSTFLFMQIGTKSLHVESSW